MAVAEVFQAGGALQVNAPLKPSNLKFNASSIAAAGSAQTNATLVPTGNPMICVVTSANTTAGVLLQPSNPGAVVIVQNSVTNQNLLVYPNQGEIINALTSNSAYTLAGAKTALFCCQVAGTWFTVLTA